MKYIGGYSILDLTDANVSEQANACYNQDKPVLVYGANGERYFADTISLDGTNVVITKGDKTITIANDNTITNVGEIQPHLYNYTFITSDENEDYVYFNYELPINFDKPSELLEYVFDNVSSYQIVGKLQGSSKQDCSISTGGWQDKPTLKFYVNALFDDEEIKNYTLTSADTFLVKKQLF